MPNPDQATTTLPTDALLGKVLVDGDLSKLNPTQRLDYYKSVCESVGLNPLTKPFDYIKLSGRLTLYARKDATDQLRRMYGISITDVKITHTDTGLITVRATGSDNTGRSDVELGSVAVKNLGGEALANAEMKALTKAKRRLTLSLCGLGMLDETEVVTIPGAEVVEATVEQIPPPPEQEEEEETPAPKAEAQSSPYYRYLGKCQELKSELGKERYYEVLATNKLNKSSEVKRSDTSTMANVIHDLMDAAKPITVRIKEQEEKLGLTPKQIESRRTPILSCWNGLEQNDPETLRTYYDSITAEK
jgi:hypothetical protein